MRTLNFDELDLHEQTLAKLKSNNLTEASPLQQSIILNYCNGQNVVIKASPGDEKNLAFVVAAREAVARREEAEGTTVLVITDSGENARNLCSQINSMDGTDGHCISADDEGDVEVQAEALSHQPDVIVANPDRLQTLLQEHRFIFRHIGLMILDQLDRLVDGGQEGNLKRIKRRVLSEYTVVGCAESYNGKIKKTVENFADKLAVIGFDDAVSGAGTPPPIAGHLKQEYINVPYRMKISTLMAHIKQVPDDTCIIFTASKRGTDRLYRVLKKQGMKATSLHDKLSDEKRAQRFANFTNGDVQYLLVADISGGMLDVKRVNQVINYDVPNSSDEYRFRAALLGQENAARIVSLVSKQDRSDISGLQNELGQTPEEIPLPDEVKEKLKQRKKKKSNGQTKKKSRKNNKNKKQSNKESEMQLPQPSYDKLSGGRTGHHDEKKSGIVKFFKKLFS